jgi:hypothetical protein
MKYENYRRFEADVKLTFGDAVEGDNSSGKAPSNDNKAPALDPRLKQPAKKK